MVEKIPGKALTTINIFVEGEMPIKEEIKTEIIKDAEYEELDDIDTKTLNDAIKNDVKNIED